MNDEIAKLRALNTELLAALKPFADHVDESSRAPWTGDDFELGYALRYAAKVYRLVMREES